MLSGVAVSLDGGRSWFATWPGLGSHGVVWRVMPVSDGLLAATDSGLLAYRLPATPAPGIGWWAALFGVGIGSGRCAVASIAPREAKASCRRQRGNRPGPDTSAGPAGR